MAFSMRQFLTVAPLFAVLCACLCHGQNLVTNGNFEAGYNSSWNHLAGNGSSATYSEETADPHEGSKALKVVINSFGATPNPWDVQSLGPSLSMTTGSDYTLTFWAKAAVNGTQIKTVIQNGSYLARNHTLSTTWTQYTWNFTAAEDSPSIRLQYFQMASPQTQGANCSIDERRSVTDFRGEPRNSRAKGEL